jgi:hypothetical protein
MGSESLAEMVAISTRMVELGGKLSELRTARDALNIQLQTLETELLPLVAKHGDFHPCSCRCAPTRARGSTEPDTGGTVAVGLQSQPRYQNSNHGLPEAPGYQ